MAQVIDRFDLVSRAQRVDFKRAKLSRMHSRRFLPWLR
jgi:hypothetical protein